MGTRLRGIWEPWQPWVWGKALPGGWQLSTGTAVGGRRELVLSQTRQTKGKRTADWHGGPNWVRVAVSHTPGALQEQGSGETMHRHTPMLLPSIN